MITHFIERWECGHVAKQCRCPGTKYERTRPGKCPECAAHPAPSPDALDAAVGALVDAAMRYQIALSRGTMTQWDEQERNLAAARAAVRMLAEQGEEFTVIIDEHGIPAVSLDDSYQYGDHVLVRRIEEKE